MTKFSDEFIFDRIMAYGIVKYNNIMVSLKFQAPRPVDLKVPP